MQPLPLLSPHGRQTENSWVCEGRWPFTLPCLLPLQERMTTKKVLPKRSKQLSRLAPHVKLPSRVSLRVHFWATSVHTAWVRTADKWRRARLEEDGNLPSTRHSLYDDRDSALASRYVCPSQCFTGRECGKVCSGTKLGFPTGGHRRAGCY